MHDSPLTGVAIRWMRSPPGKRNRRGFESKWVIVNEALVKFRRNSGECQAIWNITSVVV